jgi:hypothetical protein
MVGARLTDFRCVFEISQDGMTMVSTVIPRDPKPFEIEKPLNDDQ